MKSSPLSSNFWPDVVTKPVDEGGGAADVELLTTELEVNVAECEDTLVIVLVCAEVLAVAPGRHCE